MNTGMQDAINLAWKLAMVDRGEVDVDLLLDSYSAERGSNATQELKGCSHMLRVDTMHDAAAQITRDFLIQHLFRLSSVRHMAAERLSELSIHYANSPLNGVETDHAGLPQPGQRLSVEPCIEMSSRAAFTLIASEKVEAHTRVLDYLHLIDDNILDATGIPGICLRSDAYVAMTARPDGWADVIADLERISERKSCYDHGRS